MRSRGERDMDKVWKLEQEAACSEGGEDWPGVDSNVVEDLRAQNGRVHLAGFAYGSEDGRARRCNNLKRTRITDDPEQVTCLRCRKLGGLDDEVKPVKPKPAPPAPVEADDRLEWLRWRQGGLGGSDIAAILGVSPFATSFDVWWSKTQPVADTDSAAMAIGRDLEGYVAQKAAERWGCAAVPGRPVVHPSKPWIRGTADFVMTDESGELVGLECKTTRDRWPDGLPIYYEAQVRWYMLVYGLRRWRVAVFHLAPREFTFLEIEADDLIAQALEQKADAWWTRHIIHGERPPLVGAKAGEYLRERHAHHNGEIVTADASVSALVEDLHQIREQKRQLIEREEALALKVQEAIGDAKGIQAGSLVATWSRYERKQTDWRSLRADPVARDALNRLTAPYTHTTTAGRLVVREET